MMSSGRYIGALDRRFRFLHVTTDGHYVAAFGEEQVALFDARGGQKLFEWELPCPDGAFDLESTVLVLGCSDEKLRLVALPSGTITVLDRGLSFDSPMAANADHTLLAPAVAGDALAVYRRDGAEAFRLSVPGVDELTFVFSPAGGGVLFSGNSSARHTDSTRRSS